MFIKCNFIVAGSLRSIVFLCMFRDIFLWPHEIVRWGSSTAAARLLLMSAIIYVFCGSKNIFPLCTLFCLLAELINIFLSRFSAVEPPRAFPFQSQMHHRAFLLFFLFSADHCAHCMCKSQCAMPPSHFPKSNLYWSATSIIIRPFSLCTGTAAALLAHSYSPAAAAAHLQQCRLDEAAQRT